MQINPQRLFEVTQKGLSLVLSLAQQGADIKPAWTALNNIFSKHPGQVTDAELDEVETLLDEQLDDFESPMPNQA